MREIVTFNKTNRAMDETAVQPPSIGQVGANRELEASRAR